MLDVRPRAIFRRARSLRGEIAAGYVAGFAFLLVIAAILFANLVAVERRVASYAVLSRFLDTALEMRRYEKNWLLYQDPADLDEAVRYAGAAAEIARGPDVRDDETARLLGAYAARLREARDAEGYPPEHVVAEVRELGRRITLVAERLSSREAAAVQALLAASRRSLVVLVAIFLAGSVLLARRVRATALGPLEELERGMQRIAAGERALLPVPPGAGDELASMNAAFNRMIAELFEHREEVMRKERLASLGTMLAGIAHELNNPLSNVSTSAELLEEQDGELRPAERRELVRQIVSETDRATAIIRTVLDYSRERRSERRPTALGAALLDSVVLVRGELPTGVTVDLDVPPDVEVVAHKTKLQQAFINLLKNAIDAMREAGREGTIAVSARRLSGGGEVELVFRDAGAGIPADVVDRVFDPFFSTKDVGHGTGLGLYLTHQIVEQHGGTIRLESTRGVGTVVTIRLPCTPPAPAATPERAPAAAAAGGG